MSEALTRHLVTFGRVLREAGLEVGPGRMDDALRGLDRVDITRQDDVYWTLRTTLVARREDLEPFDRAFDAWFLRRAGARAGAPRGRPARACTRTRARVRRDARAGREAAPADGEPDSIGHSAHEVLRHKDFAAMTPEELAAARALIAAMVTDRPRAPLAPAARAPARARRSTCARLARDAIATGGDPVRRRFRRRTQTPRKLVVLCDVSGSMEPYTRALLLYLHAMVRSGRGVEVFAFGTRLTRLTAELRTRDPEQSRWRARPTASSTGPAGRASARR